MYHSSLCARCISEIKGGETHQSGGLQSSRKLMNRLKRRVSGNERLEKDMLPCSVRLTKMTETDSGKFIPVEDNFVGGKRKRHR